MSCEWDRHPRCYKASYIQRMLALVQCRIFCFVFIYKSKDKVIHSYEFTCYCVLSLSSREHLRTACEEECLDLKGAWESTKSFEKTAWSRNYCFLKTECAQRTQQAVTCHKTATTAITSAHETATYGSTLKIVQLS